MKFEMKIKEFDFFDDGTFNYYNDMELNTDEWVLIENCFKVWFNKVFVLDFPDGQEEFDSIMLERGFDNKSKKWIKVKFNGECKIHDHVKLNSSDIVLIHLATSGTLYYDKCWTYELNVSN